MYSFFHISGFSFPHLTITGNTTELSLDGVSEEERVDVGESLEVVFKILRQLLTCIDHLLNTRVD